MTRGSPGKRRLDDDPSEHGAWYGYDEFCLFLGREEDYLRARRVLFAKFGAMNKPTRRGKDQPELRRHSGPCREWNCVELSPSRSPSGRSTRPGPGYYPFFQFVHGLAEYRQVTWTGRSP